MDFGGFDHCYDPCPPAVEWGAWMAQVYIYGDESGKFHNSDVVSMCGYVGQRDDWQRLSQMWAQRRQNRMLPPIHMSQMFSPQPKHAWKQFRKKYSEEEWANARRGILNEFSGLISSGNIYAVGAVVDAKHFRSMPNSEFKDFYHDPVFLGFYALLFSAVKRISNVDRLGSIGFIVDDDCETAPEFYQRLTQLRAMPHEICREVSERVDAITFARDEAYPGVQAADMLAYEARRSFLGISPHDLWNHSMGSTLYDRLRPGGTQRWPLFFDAALLDRMAKSGPEIGEY